MFWLVEEVMNLRMSMFIGFASYLAFPTNTQQLHRAVLFCHLAIVRCSAQFTLTKCSALSSGRITSLISDDMINVRRAPRQMIHAPRICSPRCCFVDCSDVDAAKQLKEELHRQL